MKMIVCGGRDLWLTEDGFNYLDRLINVNGIDQIIQGGAQGIDRAAKLWADYRSIPCLTVNAEWNLYGKKAGFLRNQAMSELCDREDFCLAMPGGKGTAMMLEIARKRGLRLHNCMHMYEFVRDMIKTDRFAPCSQCLNPMCDGIACIKELLI